MFFKFIKILKFFYSIFDSFDLYLELTNYTSEKTTILIKLFPWIFLNMIFYHKSFMLNRKCTYLILRNRLKCIELSISL